MKSDENIKETVRKQYGEIAAGISDATEPTCCRDSRGAGPGCCDSELVVLDSNDTGASDDGRCCSSAELYSVDDLANLPGTVTDASLGCGDPTALASLQAGETVLDLGSGGGIDCFIAAQKVGPDGHVIGLDMTQDMIDLARRNAVKVGLSNVEFRHGEIESMPLEDSSVDVVISNCVINLSPDKDAVFAEAFRVLRPGGRLAVSDIVTTGRLPEPVLQSAAAWASCVAGALDIDDYLAKINDAGFVDAHVTKRSAVAGGTIEDSAGPEFRSQAVEAGLSVDELLDAAQDRILSIGVEARKP